MQNVVLVKDLVVLVFVIMHLKIQSVCLAMSALIVLLVLEKMLIVLEIRLFFINLVLHHVILVLKFVETELVID
jgi:hypothetical protein